MSSGGWRAKIKWKVKGEKWKVRCLRRELYWLLRAKKTRLQLPTSTYNYPYLPTARQNCRRIVPQSHRLTVPTRRFQPDMKYSLCAIWPLSRGSGHQQTKKSASSRHVVIMLISNGLVVEVRCWCTKKRNILWKKFAKNLQDKKNVVPLHSQSKGCRQ